MESAAVATIENRGILPEARSCPVVDLTVPAGVPVDAGAPVGPDTPAAVLALLFAHGLLAVVSGEPGPALTGAVGAGTAVQAG